MKTASARTSALKFGFSTLGCPELDPAGLRDLAAKYRTRFVEIRTLGGSLDFVSELAKFPGGVVAARNFFQQADVQVQLLGSSFHLVKSTEDERAHFIVEAETGEALGAKWLRVFGGGEWGDPLTEEAAALARDHRAWWKALRAERGWEIDMAFEVHDAFSGSPQVLALLEQTGGPMALLWDTHHTWKIAGETPAHSWKQLGAYVRHAHMKDSISQPSGKMPFTYVPPGQGEYPFQETLALFSQVEFGGVISLEWEKQWNPTLAPLDEVLPAWSAAIAAWS